LVPLRSPGKERQLELVKRCKSVHSAFIAGKEPGLGT
jgi:hypothetical protein